MRTPRRLLALLLTLGLLSAACGDDDATADDTSSDDMTSRDASETGDTAEDDPVTVEHAFGETVVEEVPERIVTLGGQWNGVLLEMDAPIVGYADDGFAEGGLYPWEVDVMPEEAEAIPAADSVPYEQVAALQPDLIIVTFLAKDQAGYDRLAELAPTIPLLSGPEVVDPWQELTTVAGEIMRDTDRAAAIIDDHEEQIAELAADLPGLEGRTYAFANYVPGDAIYAVADPADGAATFFSELGLSIAPDILAAADGVSGRAKLSLEQVELLDADMILLLTNGGDVDDLVGFDRLPAVQAGAWDEVTFDLAVAMNTPSALSLRWAIEQVRPALEAAAA